MDQQTFDATVSRLLSEALGLIPEETFPDRPYRSGTDHGWYEFEGTLWAKGEEIRQFLCTSGRKLTDSQADTVAAICLDAKAKRGRQSFVLLLGRKAYAGHAPAIASLLSDPSVAGQAIDTLYKMGASGYSRDIAPFLTHPMAWIRNAAKRYLTKYPL